MMDGVSSLSFVKFTLVENFHFEFGYVNILVSVGKFLYSRSYVYLSHKDEIESRFVTADFRNTIRNQYE